VFALSAVQTYEHPQNVLLLRLINGNLDLQGVHRDVPAGLTPEEAAQAQLGKSLRLWLDLQNSLNALIDSNAGVGWAGLGWAGWALLPSTHTHTEARQSRGSLAHLHGLLTLHYFKLLAPSRGPPAASREPHQSAPSSSALVKL
jgi:hypothetical protein